jgi:hypothetical protein
LTSVFSSFLVAPSCGYEKFADEFRSSKDSSFGVWGSAPYARLLSKCHPVQSSSSSVLWHGKISVLCQLSTVSRAPTYLWTPVASSPRTTPTHVSS